MIRMLSIFHIVEVVKVVADVRASEILDLGMEFSS